MPRRSSLGTQRYVSNTPEETYDVDLSYFSPCRMPESEYFIRLDSPCPCTTHVHVASRQ
jgi:hypothetical protein